jgi:hypothetical protein
VVHACQKMATLLADEPVMRQHLNQIRSALGVEQADAL